MSVPALRFKEFSQTLTPENFGHVISTNKYGPRFDASDYDTNGNVKTIRGTDVSLDGEIKYSQVPRAKLDENLIKDNLLNDGDLIMITTADCGLTGVFRKQEIEYIPSAYAVKIELNELGFPYYFKYYFQTKRVKDEINKYVRKGTVANLPLSDIGKISIKLPNIAEQTKIANFLTAVDEKITQLTQKHDLLTQYKKGVMQQIFSQELRFKDDDGEDFPEWVEHKIGELFYRSAHASKTEHITNDGKYIIVDMGSISREAKLLGTKRTNYTQDFLSTNDLIMAKDDIGGGNIIGRVVLIPENNKYICGDHVYKLTIKRGYIQYFYYAINSYKVNRSFRQKANGTAQIGISNKTVDEQLVPTPCIKEQIKIANILSAIDDKITATQTQLQAVKQYKQGLLQQMFV